MRKDILLNQNKKITKNSDFNSVEKLPDLLLVKNLNSAFLSTANSFVKLVGWKTADDSVGKTDRDITCDFQNLQKDLLL